MVRITSGVGYFDDALARRLTEFRPGILLGTMDRDEFESDEGTGAVFLEHVRDRMGWARSITLPPDGYYLFCDGALLGFLDSLPDDDKVLAKVGKAALSGAVEALFTERSGLEAGFRTWEADGNRAAEFFRHRIRVAEAPPEA